MHQTTEHTYIVDGPMEIPMLRLMLNKGFNEQLDGTTTAIVYIGQRSQRQMAADECHNMPTYFVYTENNR